MSELSNGVWGFYFFVEGMRYGEPGAMIALWLPILALPITALFGAWTLRTKGRNELAIGILLLLAIALALFALFLGLILAANPSWH